MPFDTGAYLAANQAGLNWMGRGISAAGESITTAIEKSQKDSKKLKALRGAATDIFGMEPDKVDQMSAEDIEQHMSGLVLKSSLDRQKQAQEQQAAEFDDQQQQRGAAGDFLRYLDPQPPGGVGPAAPLNPERFISAAQKSGVRLDPRELIALMRSGNDQVNWQDVMPREFEVGGQKGAVGKSGQFQFLPQATPDSLTAIPVFDDAGNVVGQRVPSGKGGSVPLPAAREPKLLPDSYNTRLNTLAENLDQAERNANKSDEELLALKISKTADEARKRYQADITRTRKAIADHVARFEGQGYSAPDFWTGEKQRLGLTAPAARATPAASGSAGSGAAGRLRKYNPATGKIE